MVLYEKMHNELKFIDGSLSVSDKGKIEWIHQVAKGMAPASVEGPDVFQALIQAVLNLKNPAGYRSNSEVSRFTVDQSPPASRATAVSVGNLRVQIF